MELSQGFGNYTQQRERERERERDRRVERKGTTVLYAVCKTSLKSLKRVQGSDKDGVGYNDKSALGLPFFMMSPALLPCKSNKCTQHLLR